MERDGRRMRGEARFVFTNLETGRGLDSVVHFVVERRMLGGARESTPPIEGLSPIQRNIQSGARPESLHHFGVAIGVSADFAEARYSAFRLHSAAYSRA